MLFRIGVSIFLIMMASCTPSRLTATKPLWTVAQSDVVHIKDSLGGNIYTLYFELTRLKNANVYVVLTGTHCASACTIALAEEFKENTCWDSKVTFLFHQGSRFGSSMKDQGSTNAYFSYFPEKLRIALAEKGLTPETASHELIAIYGSEMHTILGRGLCRTS